MSKPEKKDEKEKIRAYLEVMGTTLSCAGCMPMMGVGLCTRCVFHGLNYKNHPKKGRSDIQREQEKD